MLGLASVVRPGHLSTRAWRQEKKISYNSQVKLNRVFFPADEPKPVPFAVLESLLEVPPLRHGIPLNMLDSMGEGTPLYQLSLQT